MIWPGVRLPIRLSSYYPRMGDAEQNGLVWKNDRGSVEIRFLGQLGDGRPALDEVVANGAGVHLVSGPMLKRATNGKTATL